MSEKQPGEDEIMADRAVQWRAGEERRRAERSQRQYDRITRTPDPTESAREGGKRR